MRLCKVERALPVTRPTPLHLLSLRKYPDSTEYSRYDWSKFGGPVFVRKEGLRACPGRGGEHGGSPRDVRVTGWCTAVHCTVPSPGPAPAGLVGRQAGMPHSPLLCLACLLLPPAALVQLVDMIRLLQQLYCTTVELPADLPPSAQWSWACTRGDLARARQLLHSRPSLINHQSSFLQATHTNIVRRGGGLGVEN